MIERMTHEEYVLSVREKAALIAAEIVGGELPVLDGCHALAALRLEVEVEQLDSDFQVFALISSETDALPGAMPFSVDAIDPFSCYRWAKRRTR